MWPDRRWALMAGVVAGCALHSDHFEASRLEGTVGLDLEVTNGQAAALTLLEPGREVHVNQLRFQVNQKHFPAPDVLDWIATQSEMAALDWTGATRVTTEWAEGLSGDHQELRPYLDAAWMQVPPSFTLELRDGADQPVGAPITLAAEDYVIVRQTAVVWVDGEPARGDYGANSSAYPDVGVASGGTFTGTGDDVYTVEVSAAGPLDGTARVDVRSARGDAAQGLPVVSGAPVALGGAGRGATITFTDLDAAPAVLATGDRWIVRCEGGETPAVGAATAGTRASFSAIAEIRMQFARGMVAPTFTIPDGTAKLVLYWSARPAQPYEIPVTFAPAEDGPGYGLEVELTPDRRRYAAGETVALTIDLFDGDGKRLHEEGSLPTYRQYLAGESNGIQYYRLGQPPSAPYFLDNRLNQMRVAVFGPNQLIEQNWTDQPTTRFFVAHVDLPDVRTVVMAGVTPGSTAWDTPISNRVTFALPADAKPGTYMAVVKVARSFRGEVRYLLGEAEFQVGTDEPTAFVEPVGNCQLCHANDARLDRLRHGVRQASPRICQGCHTPTEYQALCVMLHRIHFHSPKYPVRRSGCALCHLEPGSNSRASVAVCGACHGAIHPGEDFVVDADPNAQCGQTCHDPLPPLHLVNGIY